MRYETLFDIERNFGGCCGLFSASGSFGIIDGTVTAGAITREGNTYTYANGTVALTATFTPETNGAVWRRDTLRNLTDRPLILNRFFSRFMLESCDCEVYTQYNAWQHENSGSWQPLCTQVTAASTGIRTCDGATPVMAIASRQSGKITVFHLLPNCQWKMTASRRPLYDKLDVTVLEAGIEDSGLALTVAPGEEITLPEMLFFVTDRRTDLGAHILHEVYNRRYPRRALPTLYNTWLLDFDTVRVEDIKRQADCAAELGIEMFLIDAGWFGTKANWWDCIGDWRENMVGGFAGRLAEVSEHIRSRGMRFGLWIEPERALAESPVPQEHPEYFIGNIFLNFARDDAREYIFETVCSLVDRYQIGFLKYDFNATLPYDPDHAGFYRYMQGQQKFVEAIRARYPDIYITNCAAGGHRIELGQACLFDSFWLSDNQSPCAGLRIFTDLAKRMPPSAIEKWGVLTFGGDFPEYTKTVHRALPLSCDNATWDAISCVSTDYTHAFMTGGPLGFSCNIADFPADYKETVKAFLAQYKRDRAFYASAVLFTLCDAANLIVLQYSDPEKHRCILQCFTQLVYQESLTVYPIVDPSLNYLADGIERSGADLAENGITFRDLADYNCRTLELIAR